MPETKINPVDGAEMVFVPAGGFIMGSDDGPKDEQPQRTVSVGGFWIYQYPVTNAQFAKFAAATGCAAERWKVYAQGKDNHPVVMVTWDDAVAYCQWAGVRLPTEAEWEKAARGTDGRAYPWGNEFDAEKCHHQGAGTAPVDAHPEGASPNGVMDMAGNVWEWCADWYEEGRERSARGGSWLDSPAHKRCPQRRGNRPTGWIHFGFRPAQDG